MAGHRRETGRPMQRRTRYENRRARLNDRLAVARTPVELVTAAAEFMRSIVSALPEDIAQETARSTVDALIALAESAHKEHRRRRAAA